MTTPEISLIIRTLNEEAYLAECLTAIQAQKLDYEFEILIIDSQSDDKTCEIAANFNCKILEIERSDFTYGKALNLGIENSSGSIAVIISAHCIPNDSGWLAALCQPIFDNEVDYTYGRQIGRLNVNKVSECRDLSTQFPACGVPENIMFNVNNANSAVSKEVWNKFKFDELLLGREDLDFAKRIMSRGHRLRYVGPAVVEHIHLENWRQIKNRFYRELLTELLIQKSDLDHRPASLNNAVIKIRDDLRYKRVRLNQICEILTYRSAEYFGRKSAIKEGRKK